MRALVAEGFDTWTWGGFTHPLHLHPIFQSRNNARLGRVEKVTYSDKVLPRLRDNFPKSNTINAFALPAFRRYDQRVIRAHADAVAKVVEATPLLLASA